MRAASASGFPYKVLGDQPFTAERDPCGFDELAAELKKLIVSSRPSTPFTIGIEASWGRGKSSLMGQLRRQLQEGATDGIDMREVSFNAWTAEGADVLEGLIKSVLEGMDPSALRRALRNKRLIGALKIPLLLVAGWLRVGALVNEAWEQMSVDGRTRNQINVVVRDAMDEWLKQERAKVPGAGGDRLLVVFIDDLDRCSPANVLRVFEGVKLYLDAPGFVFVIGYDEGIVGEAVADQKQYTRRATGRDYVEKIVQIVFRIPQPTDDEIDGLLAHYLNDSGTADLFDGAGRRLVIERNARNPRRIKRFVNRFILDYQLDEASQDLKAELLIKLLILETYFPDFSRLFAFTSEDAKNPIQEFLDFASARDALRRAGGGAPGPAVKDVFDFYELAPPQTADTALEMLQREVPEPFVALAQDDDFLSLIGTLQDRDEQAEILAKVQRRKQQQSADRVVEPAVKGAPAGHETMYQWIPGASGRRVLWVDDHPENNARLAELLRTSGADVQQVTDGEAAFELIKSLTPDLLLSDIGRSGNPEAGFEDLARFRSEGDYAGPVVFYSARVSQSKRARASELGAAIATSERELLDAIAAILPAPTPAPEQAQVKVPS